MIPGFLRAPPPFEPPSTVYLLISSPVKLLLRSIYRVFNALRVPPPARDPPVRVVCISDTHTLKPEALPPGDILIHAGDLTNDGTISDIQAQIDWISQQPHPHKVCIAGNHDTYLDARTRASLADHDRSGTLDWKGIHYLQHNTATVTVRSFSYGTSTGSGSGSGSISSPTASSPLLPRKLKIYGAPQIPACGPMDVFAFQYEPGSDAWTDTVPASIDILVTHIPPKNHLEIPLPAGLGCEFLLREVERVRPLLHVFGHVHWGAGQKVCHWDEAQAAYDRGIGRPNGWTRGWMDAGLWVEVARVVVYGSKAIVWERVWGGEDGKKPTRMVNAAQMRGNTGKLGTRVQVVDI